MIRTVIRIFMLMVLVAACTGEPEKNYTVKDISLDSADRDSAELWEFYTDVKFVPLDNSLKGMIYYAPKMVASDRCFYVLDVTESGAEVKKYDYEGHYLCNIGRLGHAKDEYQDLLDFAVSEKGDTVVLLTRASMMAYDSNGKFLFSDNPLEGCFVRRIQGVNGGYLCSTEYSGAAQILHVLDGNLQLMSESLPSRDVTIGVPSIVDCPIQTGGGRAFYYDSYASTLYQMNDDYSDVQQSVHFDSKYALSPERFSDENVYDGEIDHVCDYLVDGDVMIGHVRLTTPSYGTPLFVYRISAGELSLHDSKYYSPRLVAARNGHHYALIAQDEFMELRHMMKNRHMAASFKSNYFDVVDSVNEKSNYVLMIAQPKKGYRK